LTHIALTDAALDSPGGSVGSSNVSKTSTLFKSKRQSIIFAGKAVIAAQQMSVEQKRNAEVKRKLPFLAWGSAHFTQLIMYGVFVGIFVNMITLVQPPALYRSTNYFMRLFVLNTFDGDHNTLMTVRRRQDFWEWGHNVLLPGLFSDSSSAQAWSDGSGYMAQKGATAYSLEELKEEMNQIGSFAGVQFKQTRVAQEVGGEYAGQRRVPHWPSYVLWAGKAVGEETRPFGIDTNSASDSNNGQRFVYLSQQELGSTYDISASLISTARYPEGGYAAYMLPFFSARYIQPLTNRPMGEVNYTGTTPLLHSSTAPPLHPTPTPPLPLLSLSPPRHSLRWISGGWISGGWVHRFKYRAVLLPPILAEWCKRVNSVRSNPLQWHKGS
jgi:hypothetical protein